MSGFSSWSSHQEKAFLRSFWRWEYFLGHQRSHDKWPWWGEAWGQLVWHWHWAETGTNWHYAHSEPAIRPQCTLSKDDVDLFDTTGSRNSMRQVPHCLRQHPHSPYIDKSRSWRSQVIGNPQIPIPPISLLRSLNQCNFFPLFISFCIIVINENDCFQKTAPWYRSKHCIGMTRSDLLPGYSFRPDQ